MTAMWNLVFGSFVDTERNTKKNLPKETNIEKFNKYKNTVREKVTFCSKVGYQEPPPEKALAPEPEAPDPLDSQPDDHSKLLQIDKLRKPEDDLQSPIEEMVSHKCPTDTQEQGLLNELAYEYAMCSPEFNNNILELFCGNMCSGNSLDVLRVADDDFFAEVDVESPPPPETNENMELERQYGRKNEKRSTTTTADVLINDQSSDSINSKHREQDGGLSCEILDDGFEMELSEMYQILAKHYNDDVF